MNIPRRLLLTLGLAALVGLLTACAGTDAPTANESATDTSPPVSDSEVVTTTETLPESSLETVPSTERESVSESEIPPETVADTQDDTAPAPESETLPETDPPIVVHPDPSTVTYMIEDFNHITDPKASLDPLDLSFFGIVHPEWRFDDTYAQEGKAFVSIPSASAWCQAYQIRRERLDAFDQAVDGQYVRMYVCTPDNVSVALTLGLGAGNRQSFLDPTAAIVTRKNGEVLACTIANATDDAGVDSSLSIPAGFEGYLAYPVAALKPWAANASITDLSAVDYLKIDARPSGMSFEDRYILDALCITDSPVAEIITGGPGSNKPAFDTKNEELAYMFEQILQMDTVIVDECPAFNPQAYPNIKAVWIQGPKMGNHDTKFFAFIGFPEGASASNPVPAVVLNHGGGGYAYASWVDIWNQKGYAAIAIGNTGYAPTVPGMPDFYSNASWTHTLTDDMFADDPRVLPPDNDGMYTSTGPIDRMWMYHAVSQTILANTLLRNDARVDANRVGVTGISWGGVITSIAIGYDSRFAFAVPVYGSGYLHESLSWMKQHFNATGTRELWDASLKLKEVKMPVLWLAWTNDTCFSINTNSKSFDDTENGVLTFLSNMGHGHIEGWNPVEIYRFADSVVRDGEPLTTCKTQPTGVGTVSFTINRPADADRVVARVYYLTEKMTYSADSHIEQSFQTKSGSVSGDTVTVTIPEETWSYYVEITTVIDGQKYITSTRYVTVR